MEIKKSSLEIVKDFLKSIEISISPEIYLDKLSEASDNLQLLPIDIVSRIIADAYGLSDQAIKNISGTIQKKFNIYLGRIQKNQLKKYIDYGFESDFYTLKNLIMQELESEFNLKEYCDSLIKEENLDFKETVNLFKQNRSILQLRSLLLPPLSVCCTYIFNVCSRKNT